MAAPSITGNSTPKAAGFLEVFSLLKNHMAELDTFLRDQTAAFEPEIREMANYCIDTSGKRIRPSLVFFSGWRGPERISSDLVKVAAVVELVHLATLVHDDIMDNAELRRNRRTAVREYGAEAAVLLGDALFSHALNLATQFPSTEVCQAVSDSMRKVCAGEIVQTLRRGHLNMSLGDYRRVIDLKTAELFRVSCFLGSRLGGHSSEFVEAASRYGRSLGIAYQIYDDLADFLGDEKSIGKTLGTDLASGKITLPLLRLLERLPSDDKAELEAEITGRRAPNIGLRLQQMAEKSVPRSVREEIFLEIGQAEHALRGFPQIEATIPLHQICGVLRQQVDALFRTDLSNLSKS